MLAKAADQIVNKGEVISTFRSVEKEQRWNAVLESNFEEYKRQNEKLTPTQYIPVFLHTDHSNTMTVAEA